MSKREWNLLIAKVWTTEVEASNFQVMVTGDSYNKGYGGSLSRLENEWKYVYVKVKGEN